MNIALSGGLPWDRVDFNYNPNSLSGSMKIAGAEIVMFYRFDDRVDLVATAKGMTFSETVGEDGPLAAGVRLGTRITRYFEFGKRRRAFRTKQRSILVRRKYAR